MIYYEEENLVIRSMMEEDAKRLFQGFHDQGWHKPVLQFMDYYNQQEMKEKQVIIAGYVTLLPNAESGPFAHRKVPEIVDFNVLIKYQKRGIGNRIMDVAEKLAKVSSDYVSLSVGLHSGYGSAQRMYVKRGYIPDGTGVWYHGKRLEQYAKCENDDDLTLYFLKTL